MKCKVCGHEMNDHSNFCSNCGAKVRVKNNRSNEIEEFLEETRSDKSSKNTFETIGICIFSIFKLLFNCLKSILLFIVLFLYELVKHSK